MVMHSHLCADIWENMNEPSRRKNVHLLDSFSARFLSHPPESRNTVCGGMCRNPHIETSGICLQTVTLKLFFVFSWILFTLKIDIIIRVKFCSGVGVRSKHRRACRLTKDEIPRSLEHSVRRIKIKNGNQGTNVVANRSDVDMLKAR